MMRMTSALLVAGAMFVACSWGEGSGDDGPSGGGGVDAAVSSAVCGDAVCAASEIGFCAQDCGATTTPTCGNNMCETGETSATCPNDCGGTGSGSGSGSGSASTCPADPIECAFCAIAGQMCPAGHDMTSCTACLGAP